MPTTLNRHGYTSDDVTDLAGISYRQLDYWTRVGVLQPLGHARPGSGYERRWSQAEVRVATVVGRLANLGATRHVLRPVAEMVRAMSEDEWHGELLVSPEGRVGHLRAATAATFGEACWVVNLDLVAHRLAA